MIADEGQTPSAWDGDWRERIRNGLHRLGYQTLGQLFRSKEVATYAELIEQLGGQLAPVQIRTLWRDGIADQAEFDFFVRSTLVRELHGDCPRGWRAHREFDLIQAYGAWAAELDDAYKYECRAVFKRLRSRTDLPAEWLPSGVNDPVIQEIFEGIEFRLHGTG